MSTVSRSESIPFVYRLVMAVGTPVVRWWGRLRVEGLDQLPPDGPVALFANHDSQWDPVVIGIAALPRRQIRALAKSTLWKFRPVAWVLDRMGQIPIERGRADLAAMSAAVDRLSAGGCVGIFPEGTISRGEALRPLSGGGRLVLAAPQATVVCVAATGVVDIARFPRRPRITVKFFRPAGGQAQPDESAVKLTKRVMTEIREAAPFTAAGRKATG